MPVLGKPGRVRKPRALRVGDKVRVVAPAGAWDDTRMRQGRTRLEAWGLRVDGPPQTSSYRYMSAADSDRAADLKDAFMDEDSAAIVCARGGFGSARTGAELAPGFFEHVPPKLFVGFSDVSILLMRLVEEAGLVCFHGPMVAADLPSVGGPAIERFRRMLFGEPDWWDGKAAGVWREGRASGILVGGCLSVLVTTLGTPYELQTTGRVLFVEDVAEPSYRIDRRLTQLGHAGKLESLAGLVSGSMTDCDDGQGSDRLAEIVMDVVGQRSYPVLFGLDAGHCSGNTPLPFGCEVSVDSSSSSVELLESPLAG